MLAFPHNPQAPSNQLIYLRALATVPNLTIHKDGWFASHPATLPEAPLFYPQGPGFPPRLVRVVKMEEKRTDVDIATHLLVDCFDHDFDEAAVISNDSDLSLPIEVVKSKFGKNIIAINPHRPWKMSKQLTTAASRQIRTINKSVLRNCQFPQTLTDAVGAFTKPPEW